MIAPFPWHALPRVSAEEARATRALARAFGPGLRARATAAASELLAQRVSLDLRRRWFVALDGVELGARGALVVLESERGPLVLEVEAELALAVVGALSGRRTLPKIARGRAIPAEVVGALAGVSQWLARACGIDAQVDAREGAPTAESARAALARGARGASEARVVVLDLTASVGALRGGLRLVTVPPATVPAAPPARPLDVLRALGEAPLSVAAVIGAGWLPAREAVRVGVGDVFAVSPVGAHPGAVVLAPAEAEAGVSAERSPGVDAKLRLGARRVWLAPEPTSVERGSGRSDGSAALAEPDLAHAASGAGDAIGAADGATVEIAALDDGGPLVEALADAPVLVRVEVGTVTLPARDWAALGVGDVVTLDRRVGEAVQLRIGGRVVARGELVDVDGAIGLRVLERLP